MSLLQSGQEIVSGSWNGDDAWRTMFTSEIPPELFADPRLCSAVGIVALASDEELLPRVLMTRRQVGRNGARPRWEIPCGHVDPLDPAFPQGEREPFEDAGRREMLEEAGAMLGDLTLFAVCDIANPSASKYPPRSFILYYYASVEGVLGPPKEVGHTAMAMRLSRIGELVRMPTEESKPTTDKFSVSGSDAKIIRAGVIAAGYDERTVKTALGLL